LDTIESIRKAKRKAAELADTTLSLVNSKEIDTASSYYLKALEEVGRIKILQDNPADEIAKTEWTFIENADRVTGGKRFQNSGSSGLFGKRKRR
jgi:hypothetical protein